MADSIASVLDRHPRAFKDFASKILTSQTGSPILVLSNLMDLLFESEPWVTFDYETLEQLFIKWGLPRPSSTIFDQLQAISAFRNGRSFIDKEWHLFEKAAAAFSGIPVFFYEKQNLPIENVGHAVKIMEKIGAPEYSEEVRHYIGCEAINDEILWHPDKFIDSCILFSLDTLKESIGIARSEIDSLRTEVPKRFAEYTSKDIATAQFDESSTIEMMCSRIIRSLFIGKNLLHLEVYFLNLLENAKSGQAVSEGLSEEARDILVERMEEPAKFEDPPEITEVEMVTPDMIPSTYEFDESIKTAFIKELENAHVYKAAHIPGVPIATGVPSSGMTYSKDDPNRFMEKTEPIPGNAEEKMKKSLDEAQVDRPKDSEMPNKYEGDDGFWSFRL